MLHWDNYVSIIIWHICQIFNMHMWEMYAHTYTTYEVNGINWAQGTLYTYLTTVSEQIWLLHLKCRSHIQHATWTVKLPKHNQLQFLLHILSNMCYKQVCPLNWVSIPYTPNTFHANIGDKWTFIYYIWSHWHLPFNKEHCTHIWHI